jgi:hypothetical protein
MFPVTHRRNLITVASCDEHNLVKSKDDEYLRYLLACAPGVNAIAINVLGSSIIPSFDRRPHIIDTFMDDLQPVQFAGVDTATFKVDLKRFTTSVMAIAKGLYFHRYFKRLNDSNRVAWAPLMNFESMQAPYVEVIRQVNRLLPPQWIGENPAVFRYDISFSRNHSLCLIRMMFYEGHPIFITADL